MVEQKLWELVKSLSKKTEEGRLEWEVGSRLGTFLASFPESGVAIREREGDYVIELLSSTGAVIETAGSAQLESSARPENPHTALRKLYIMARRSAHGTDKVLDDVLGRLKDL